MTKSAHRRGKDSEPGHVGRRAGDGCAPGVLLSRAKGVYGRSVSESLHPTPPFTGVAEAAAPLPPVSEARLASPAPGVGGLPCRGPEETDDAAPPARPITAPMSPVRRADRGRGFAIEVDGLGDLGCGDVRGF